ncbi:hypothetical protein K491DRAFT_693792 [Lophiostoma macrostomum CBS 122681]|uniref:Uncharacterized protein n=1 Tax=Lophiostoma macrostomum CBS 122681 TaxID=1314788 RepID=A0A6A6T7F7_9PLEO|nr:hypothetical protein K491DRAFT_693792 [Lophiostoma macrostomum CBS 122681]
MASEQTFSTHDLRSGAKEFARDKDHRVKWAHGQSFGPGRREEDARPRPARVVPTPKSGNRGLDKARAAIKTDINYASGESSADEDIEEPSAAPAPDAEITYSFDAERGPSHGSQVLGHALAQAIERYEVRQTDKLIKEEYEVLDYGALSPAPKVGKNNPTGEDDEYEFV